MIYLDSAATMRPNKQALSYAAKFNEEFFYNPSALYEGSSAVKKEIDAARENLRGALKSKEHKLIFTSGGTESINTALSQVRKTVIISSGEHAATYNYCKRFSTVLSSIDKHGAVITGELIKNVKVHEPDFVSLIHVNNETGAINDVNMLAHEIKKINSRIKIHVDGVQAFKKIDYSLSGDIDFYSCSAHKIGGVKGTGALYYKSQFKPMIDGGGQENNLRSGTENVFGIKVFEKAAEIYDTEQNYNTCKKLKKLFCDNLTAEHVKISGKDSSPYILTVSFPKLKGEVILRLLEKEGVLASSKSACSSTKKYSRIITACGYGEDILSGVIRISLCAEISAEDASAAAKTLTEAVNGLRKKLWKKS